MKFKSALLLIGLLSLCSCGKGSSGSSSAQTGTKTTDTVSTPGGASRPSRKSVSVNVERKVELAEDISNVEDFKREINSYVVTFKIKAKRPETMSVSCYKLNFDETKKGLFSAFDGNGISTTFIEVTKTDPNEVQFECDIKNEDDVIIETKSLSLKKSFVISGTENFPSIGLNYTDKVGTLFFDKKAKLTTDGHEVRIEAEEVISLDGTITTFLESDALNKNTDKNGLPGETISLISNKAYGNLKVVLRGMDGGKVTTKPDDAKDLSRDPSLNGNCRSDCNGRKGNKGIDGVKGNPGFAGGNTGSLRFEVKDSESPFIKIDITYLPGKGSEGGLPGKPGKGSPGGIGDTSTTYSERCSGHGDGMGCMSTTTSKKHPDGPAGDPGNPAPKGDNGKDGEIDASIIIFGTEETHVDRNWNN